MWWCATSARRVGSVTNGSPSHPYCPILILRTRWAVSGPPVGDAVGSGGLPVGVGAPLVGIGVALALAAAVCWEVDVVPLQEALASSTRQARGNNARKERALIGVLSRDRTRS